MICERKGNTLIEMMVIVAIIAAVAAIAVPNFLKARVVSNQSTAQETLKAVGTALANYQITMGVFPSNIGDLLTANPAYLSKDYFSDTYAGYDYTVVTLEDYEYSITATPSAPNMGAVTYNISTGSILTEM